METEPNAVRLPEKIDPCPISEAFFEIRFVSDYSGEIPGLIYADLGSDYSKAPPPPIVNIPEEIRNSDPAFRFMPTTIYAAKEFTLGLGARSLNLSTPPFQYPGWARFEAEIRRFVTILHKRGIVREIERVGLRYINFFPHENMWEQIRVDVTIAGVDVGNEDLHLRTSTTQGRLSCLTQIAHPAYARRGTEQLQGTLIDLDASCSAVDATEPDQVLALVGELHDLEKRQFFRILSPEYLAKLNPSYQSKA